MKATRIDGVELPGRLLYSREEHSFRFEPDDRAELVDRVDGQGVTSVVFDTLQLEVAIATKQALFVWGLHSYKKWSSASLGTPQASVGSVVVIPDENLILGVSVRDATAASISTVLDDASGWIRVSLGDLGGEELVRIASDVVLGIRDDFLSSIWMHPEFE